MVQMWKPPKHILVIRLSAMGDVAMAVPVLRALVQQYPTLKITVLTRPFFAPFFRDVPNTTVFPVLLKDEHKGVIGLFRLSRQLKKQGMGAVADLHNVLRTNILKIFLNQYKFVQIDKGRKEKKALVSGKLFEQLKPTYQRYAEVFEKLGYAIDLSNPMFPQKATLSSRLWDLVGCGNKNLIGIAPFAAHKGKMYPMELMTVIIEELSKDCQIILFGGGDQEVSILKELEQSFVNVKNTAGKLTLDEELDVISNLDAMLSMDSANAHMAAMLGIKTITIWGVTHPFAGFAPFNQPRDFALVANKTQFPKIPTSVYGNSYPENYAGAAGSIAPAVVINKIRSII